MNKKQIRKILSERFNDWLFNSIKNEELKTKIKDNCFVAGGSITSLLLEERINDIDIYISSIDIAYELVEYYIKEYKTINNNSLSSLEIIKEKNSIKIKNISKDFLIGNKNKKYSVCCITENAISLFNDIQIIFKFVGEPSTICNNFDFAHTKNYWLPKNDDLILNKSSLESIITKQLYYTNSDYPVASLFRMKKFLKRGWNINAGQMLKIILDINKLNLQDINILRKQLIGIDMFYFREILNKIEEDDNDKYDASYLIKTIDKIFEN